MLDAVSGEGMLSNHSLHLNGRTQCIGSVIGVAHRDIEGCQYGVALELSDDSLMTFEDLHHD